MSVQLAEVITNVFGITVGVLLIVVTLLHRVDITWFIRPRSVKKRPFPVGASLLLAAGMVPFDGTRMTPVDYQRVWGRFMAAPGGHLPLHCQLRTVDDFVSET